MHHSCGGRSETPRDEPQNDGGGRVASHVKKLQGSRQLQNANTRNTLCKGGE